MTRSGVLMFLKVKAYETANKAKRSKAIFTFKLEVFFGVSIEMLGLDDQGYLKGSHTIQ